jgi:hypothetical protein
VTWSTSTPLGEQFLDVAAGEAETQVPADGNDDDVGWEAEASEGGSRNGSKTRTAGSHAESPVTRTRSWRTQQRSIKSTSQAKVANLKSQDVATVLEPAAPGGISSTYFLRLTLTHGSQTVTAQYRHGDLQGATPVVTVAGWNLGSQTVLAT